VCGTSDIRCSRAGTVTTAGRSLCFPLIQARADSGHGNDAHGCVQSDQTRCRHFAGPACRPEGNIVTLTFGLTRRDADQSGIWNLEPLGTAVTS
jgi:hypothetical protein